MAVRLSTLSAGRPLSPGIFLVLISVRGSIDPRAIVRLEVLGQFKKSNDLIGTWTSDLPACSVVPQSTTLPRATWLCSLTINISDSISSTPWGILKPIYSHIRVTSSTIAPVINQHMFYFSFLQIQKLWLTEFLRERNYTLFRMSMECM
jgi:hypothetical protein